MKKNSGIEKAIDIGIANNVFMFFLAVTYLILYEISQKVFLFDAAYYGSFLWIYMMMIAYGIAKIIYNKIDGYAIHKKFSYERISNKMIAIGTIISILSFIGIFLLKKYVIIYTVLMGIVNIMFMQLFISKNKEFRELLDKYVEKWIVQIVIFIITVIKIVFFDDYNYMEKELPPFVIAFIVWSISSSLVSHIICLWHIWKKKLFIDEYEG